MLKLRLYAGLALGFALLGCQPAPNGNNAKFARNAYGSPNLRPQLSSTRAVALTNAGGDQYVTQQAQLFAAPSLSNLPNYQLGSVSATNGITMWGEAILIGDADSGTLDAAQSRLHIEINDSRVGQSDGAGGRLEPYTLHIGYDNAGFEGADGGVSGGQVALRFDQAGWGSVLITGFINGNQFSGQVSFVNLMSEGQVKDLGNFTVATCSFFNCGGG